MNDIWLLVSQNIQIMGKIKTRFLSFLIILYVIKHLANSTIWEYCHCITFDSCSGWCSRETLSAGKFNTPPSLARQHGQLPGWWLTRKRAHPPLDRRLNKIAVSKFTMPAQQNYSVKCPWWFNCKNIIVQYNILIFFTNNNKYCSLYSILVCCMWYSTLFWTV